MLGWEQVETLPHLAHRDGGHEESRGILTRVPFEQAGIWTRFAELADGVGIQNEVHNVTQARRSYLEYYLCLRVFVNFVISRRPV